MLHRYLVSIAFAVVLLAGQVTGALAVTTGSISGKVTDATTHEAIANAKVSAVSASGTYMATTNPQGYFVLLGLAPDTYTVNVSKDGYEASTVSGVTIVQGGVAIGVSVTLGTTAKTLGKVTVRGVSNYVQPTQTADSYVVSPTATSQLLNDPFGTNEAALLTSLPGVSSANGFPIFRGGLENQAGISVEGITVTDPFTNQFANNLIFNGVASFTVVQGAGDASQGGAGTGGINSVAKIGTYPPFGAAQTEIGFGAYQHNINFEQGGASPDQRFSYYISGRYNRIGGVPGIYHTQDVQRLNDTTGDLSFTTTDDTVVNLHFKSPGGRNDLQGFFQTGTQRFYGNYGINTSQLFQYTQDPNYQTLYPLFAGVALGPQQLPAYPTISPLQVNPSLPNQTQTYSLAKIQYSTQLNASSYLSARLYKTTGVTPFYVTESNYPYLGSGFPGFNFGDFYELESYRQTGAAFDLQSQLSNRNSLTVGAEYRQSTGAIVTASPSISFLLDGPFLSDFGPGGVFGPGTAVGGVNGARIPTFSQTSADPVYFANAYVTDVIKPTDKLTIQPGLRFDGQRVPTPAGLYNVHQFSPKLGLSYEVNPNTVVRVSYGHATIFAPLGQIEGAYTPPTFYHQFPASAPLCGQFPQFGQPCKDYFQEIQDSWYATNGVAPYSFPGPEQSDSYDLSFEHDFGHNISMKLTPYYRRDYDVIVSQSGLPIIISGQPFNGPQVLTNNAKGNTFGIELGVSRQVPQGLSGQFNVTYINQFINYLSNGAFLPSVLNSTLAVQVHPVYLPPFAATLALDEHHNSWHINPTFIFSRGTPTGIPDNTYTLINGVYQAVPNTNLISASAGNCFFVDPQLPGSIDHPNIVGSLGGSCVKARDGGLTKANLLMNFGISKSVTDRITAGLSVYNVFDNRANGFSQNPGYINNGFGAYGPSSGFNQYAPGVFTGNGLNPIIGAPLSFPPGPYFVTNSGPARYGTFYVTVKT